MWPGLPGFKVRRNFSLESRSASTCHCGVVRRNISTREVDECMSAGKIAGDKDVHRTIRLRDSELSCTANSEDARCFAGGQVGDHLHNPSILHDWSRAQGST